MPAHAGRRKSETVRVWDLATGSAVATSTAEGRVLAVVAAVSGDSLLAGDETGRLHILTLETDLRGG